MKKIFVIVLIVLVVLFVGRNFLIKTGMVVGAKLGTGLYLSADRVDLNPFAASFGLDGLKLYNPEGFLDPFMVNIPEILVNVKVGSLFDKKIHLQKLIFDLDTVYIIKNKAGEMNIDAFKSEKKEEEKPKKKVEKKPTEKKKGEPMKLKIDYARIRIGKVIYKDYSAGEGAPSIKEYAIDIDKEYNDVNNPTLMISGLVTTIMTKTSLASIPGVDLGALGNMGGAFVGSASDMAGGLADSAGKSTEALSESTSEAVDAIRDEVGGALKSLGGFSDKLKLKK